MSIINQEELRLQPWLSEDPNRQLWSLWSLRSLRPVQRQPGDPWVRRPVQQLRRAQRHRHQAGTRQFTNSCHIIRSCHCLKLFHNASIYTFLNIVNSQHFIIIARALTSFWILHVVIALLIHFTSCRSNVPSFTISKQACFHISTRVMGIVGVTKGRLTHQTRLHMSRNVQFNFVV